MPREYPIEKTRDIGIIAHIDASRHVPLPAGLTPLPRNPALTPIPLSAELEATCGLQIRFANLECVWRSAFGLPVFLHGRKFFPPDPSLKHQYSLYFN